MSNSNGRNGNGKGAHRCATPGCANTAQPSGYCFPCECERARCAAKAAWLCKTPGCYHVAADSGYCDLCELEYARFAKEAADWWALRDAAEANKSGWARR